MARVKRGVTAHAKHKKTYKAAKGFYGRRKNTIRAAKAAVDRSMQYATRDRRIKKRDFRGLWIQRINAAVRLYDITYSKFIHLLNKLSIEVDRKVLADLAVHDKIAFASIAETIKNAINGTAIRYSSLFFFQSFTSSFLVNFFVFICAPFFPPDLSLI